MDKETWIHIKSGNCEMWVNLNEWIKYHATKRDLKKLLDIFIKRLWENQYNKDAIEILDSFFPDTIQKYHNLWCEAVKKCREEWRDPKSVKSISDKEERKRTRELIKQHNADISNSVKWRKQDFDKLTELYNYYRNYKFLKIQN